MTISSNEIYAYLITAVDERVWADNLANKNPLPKKKIIKNLLW
ncbi:hypothetical protein [Scytonema hofmannii]|nr:hypothetical protein [Scytonema hofmannii]